MSTVGSAPSIVDASEAQLKQQPVSTKGRKISIYHLYSLPYRRVILGATAMLALLTPFSDTVYLPALALVREDFDSSDTMVALTVSIYLACVGVGQLLWGTLSDRYGRHKILMMALVVFFGLTLACIFSASIEVFLVMRSLQGFVVGATVIIAQAVIADVFPGYERGEAMGAFLGPMLIGPVIAPLLGGIVAQAFGWRSCFMMLAVLTGPILLLTYFCVPETHHYYVMKKIHREPISNIINENSGISCYTAEGGSRKYEVVSDSENQAELTKLEGERVVEVATSQLVFEKYDPDEALRVRELLNNHNHDYDALQMSLIESTVIAEPVLEKPWSPILLLLDPLMSPFMFTCATAFAVMFSTLTVAPILFVQEPYNLTETAVGVTFLAFGFGALIGAMYGGKLSDDSQKAFPQCFQGRLVYVMRAMPLIIIGGLTFAYTIQNGVHISIVLISQFAIGFVQSALMTSCMVYLGELRPKMAAAACAMMMCLCFVFAAICVACAVPAAEKISLAGYFWVMCGVYSVTVLGWVLVVRSEMAKATLAQDNILTKSTARVPEITLNSNTTIISQDEKGDIELPKKEAS